MGTRDVELFSWSQLEEHTKREIERALKSDRKIQKYEARKTFWTHFEWEGVLLLIGTVSAIAIIAAAIVQPWEPSAQHRSEADFRFVSDSCFVANGEEYCAVIQDKAYTVNQ